MVDTDTGQWSRWVTRPDGSADWIWREDIAGLLAGHLFMAGCKTNQGTFYPRFDHIVLLSAPAPVLLARIAARTGNPYGKHPAERPDPAASRRVEPRLRATATIETRRLGAAARRGPATRGSPLTGPDATRPRQG